MVRNPEAGVATDRTPTADLVSVVVPARDASETIARCVDALGAQTYPLDRLEVVVCAAQSGDGTEAIAKDALSRHRFSRGDVLTDGDGTTPANLNAGLAHALGSSFVE